MRNRTHNKVWRRYEGKRMYQVDIESNPYYVRVIATHMDGQIAYAVVRDDDDTGFWYNVIARYSYTDEGNIQAYDHALRLNRTQ